MALLRPTKFFEKKLDFLLSFLYILSMEDIRPTGGKGVKITMDVFSGIKTLREATINLKIGMSLHHKMVGECKNPEGLDILLEGSKM